MMFGLFCVKCGCSRKDCDYAVMPSHVITVFYHEKF